MCIHNIACIFFIFNISLTQAAAPSEDEVQTLEEQEFGTKDKLKKNLKESTAVHSDQKLDDVQLGMEPPAIKPIEAEEFKVTLKKKSHSGHVLLFEDPLENRPRPGKILLIKNAAQEIVAVRVLKNYPGKFVAKVVLPIGGIEVGSEYRALKKLGDKIVQLLKDRAKKKDLDAAKTDEDLAKEVEPSDEELDRGIPVPKSTSSEKPKTPEPPKPKPLFDKEGNDLDADTVEINDDEAGPNDVLVQDQHPFETNHHAVTAEYGQLSNVDRTGGATRYTGAGLRYAYNFKHPLVLRKPGFQDMLSFEAGFFFYSINGFQNIDDAITVFPLILDVRYSVLPGDTFSLFVYLGGMKNFATQSSGNQKLNTNKLAQTSLAAGTGVMIKLGPGWAARLDVGLDIFGVGAVLKF